MNWLRLVYVPMQILRYATRYILNNHLSRSSTRALSTIKPDDTKPPFLMVASIGNPEPDYSGSRHSVGHWVLEQLVQNHWKNFSRFQKHRNISRGPYSVSQDSVSSNVLLFKSNETYMNLQGEPIHANWSEVRRIQSRQFSPALVVVHDEISLPLGKIQIRKQGSSPRGHNGLRSIDKIMGQNYTKIAVGVGKPPNKYVADFVLAKFKRPEVEVLEYDVMPQIVQVLEQMTKGEHIFEVSKAPEKRQRQPRPRQNTKKDSISEVVESAASTASS